MTIDIIVMLIFAVIVALIMFVLLYKTYRQENGNTTEGKVIKLVLAFALICDIAAGGYSLFNVVSIIIECYIA